MDVLKATEYHNTHNDIKGKDNEVFHFKNINTNLVSLLAGCCSRVPNCYKCIYVNVTAWQTDCCGMMILHFRDDGL